MGVRAVVPWDTAMGQCHGTVPPLLQLRAWGRALGAGCSGKLGSPTEQGCCCTPVSQGFSCVSPLQGRSCLSLSHGYPCNSLSRGCSYVSPLQRCFCMSPSWVCSCTGSCWLATSLRAITPVHPSRSRGDADGAMAGPMGTLAAPVPCGMPGPSCSTPGFNGSRCPALPCRTLLPQHSISNPLIVGSSSPPQDHPKYSLPSHTTSWLFLQEVRKQQWRKGEQGWTEQL